MTPLTAAVVNFLGVLLGLWLAVYGFSAARQAYAFASMPGVLLGAVLWGFGIYTAYLAAQYAARNLKEYREGRK